MRATSGKGKRLNVPSTLDGQLMQRLVENTIGSHQNGMKDDFIVAHFRTPCSLCAQYCDGVRTIHHRRCTLQSVLMCCFRFLHVLLLYC